MSNFDESYSGQDIVPAQSILRKVPHVVEPELNLRLDAIVFASDALQYSFMKMHETAVLAGPGGKGKTPKFEIALLVAAWDVVNQLDAIRQLLNALLCAEAERDALTQRLFEFLETAKVLRNKMAHLNQSLANRAQLSGSKSPLFGSLSYAWMDEEGADKGYVALIQAGQLPTSTNIPVVNPVGKLFWPPVGLFQLSAFETEIELGPPLALLSTFLHSISNQLNEQLSDQIERLAHETGISVEELWGHPASGLSVFLVLSCKAT